MVPSLLETILFHGFFAPTDLSVQDCPESSDVQMVPKPHGSEGPMGPIHSQTLSAG